MTSLVAPGATRRGRAVASVVWAALAVLATALAPRAPAAAQDELYADFVDPPTRFRPFVRWWWNGGVVTEAELLRELDLFPARPVARVRIRRVCSSAETARGDAEQQSEREPDHRSQRLRLLVKVGNPDVVLEYARWEHPIELGVQARHVTPTRETR